MGVCADRGEAGAVLYWIFEAPVGSSAWEYAGQVCRAPGEAGGGGVPVVSLEDLRRLPLPAGVVHVEPPSLVTLVNVPTNVYVGAGPVILATSVLGVGVRVRATPVRFRWSFGDGGVLVTRDPGAPYPDLRTTHAYVTAGQRRVGLVTEYRGEYSVTGGPWLPIEGTARVASPPVTLTVNTASNQLIAEPTP